MTNMQIIQTVIEIILTIFVILAVIYEPILIKFEEKQGEKMLKKFNQFKRKREAKK